MDDYDSKRARQNRIKTPNGMKTSQFTVTGYKTERDHSIKSDFVGRQEIHD